MTTTLDMTTTQTRPVDALHVAAEELRALGSRLDEERRIDRIAVPLHGFVSRTLPSGPGKDALQGRWLGHPLHPALSDLPIGFWTSAFVVDLVGGRRAQPAADLMVGLGVLTAIPTMAAGVADWSDMDPSRQRSGVVHAAMNLVATALYTKSFIHRRRGRRLMGIAWALAGAAAATMGGYLGGHLAFAAEASVKTDPGDHRRAARDGGASSPPTGQL
jgi:uncharacterized membrane protein